MALRYKPGMLKLTTAFRTMYSRLVV